MRIWHKQLIPILCQKHLCAMWREGLGAYKVITEDKKGYRNHPATKEFEDCPEELHKVLSDVRKEMLNRGYNPKELPAIVYKNGIVRPWQSLEQQIEVLRSKGCKCKI